MADAQRALQESVHGVDNRPARPPRPSDAQRETISSPGEKRSTNSQSSHTRYDHARYGHVPAPVEEGERLPLMNAGMVLAAPYIPRLFDTLGLLRDGRFADTPAAERGVHLLQFLVSGRAASPEYQLPLNKLLCGLPLNAPVPAGIGTSEREQATIAGLLQAMIGNWGALGNTSVDGLRQAFLLRGGELLRGPEDWRLTVAPGPFDMLMERLPWSFSIVRYPWMAQPLHVTWERK
jgi:hypothetical protein